MKKNKTSDKLSKEKKPKEFKSVKTKKDRKPAGPVEARILAILEVFFIALFVFSIYKLVGIIYNYEKNDAEYKKSQENYADIPDDVNGKNADIKIDLNSLQKINSDIIGWIYIDDTVISYPLLKADNNDKYLDLTYNNKKSSFGSIFVDCNASDDFSDRNTFIYGHNMNNGSMFGTLKWYKRTDYLTSHPYVYIITNGTTFKYKIFSAYTTLTTDSTYTSYFENDSAFVSYIRERFKLSTPAAQTFDVTGKEKIITLSTCTSRVDNERFVVQAVLEDSYENDGSAELS